MSVFGDVAEIVLEFVGDVLIDYILKPIFKNIGTSVRWLFYLGNKSYKEIYLKKHNTLYGFMIIITSILLFIYIRFF